MEPNGTEWNLHRTSQNFSGPLQSFQNLKAPLRTLVNKFETMRTRCRTSENLVKPYRKLITSNLMEPCESPRTLLNPVESLRNQPLRIIPGASKINKDFFRAFKNMPELFQTFAELNSIFWHSKKNLVERDRTS